MRAISPRERKLIAAAILLVAVLLGFSLVVSPLITGFQGRAAQREILRAQYANNERTIASLPRLRRAADTNREQLAAFSIIAPNPEDGGLMLEDRLRAAFETTGGEVRASNHDSSDSAILKAGASGRVELASLVKLLSILQNRPPYLVIETLTISADEALVTQKAGPLDVKIEVTIPFIAAKS